jgi:phosphate-selective porin OprO/OprP
MKAAGWRASLFLATASLSVVSMPAFAADGVEARLRDLEQKIQELTRELQAVKQEAAAEAARAAQATQAAAAATEEQQTLTAQVEDLKRSTSGQYADVQNQRGQDTRVAINNGRAVFTSADGRFSAALRALVQFDTAYYAQSARSAVAPDLSSGTNFRRARIGFEGTLFTDWFYSFLYDMGGTGVEGSKLSDAYVQYNGFAPFRLRTGSFATPSGLEDQTGTGDLIFAERAAPADLARSIAAADGRQNLISVFANGMDYYAAISLSGARSGDPAFFDEQQAVVTRAAYRVFSDPDTNVVLNGTTTYVYKVGDTAASPAGASPLTLQVGPEHSVDGTRLISTGAINADSLFNWGLEAAANYKNFYVQGGYFDFAVSRRASTLPDPRFGGWYSQATWVLTGEPRRYNGATATWQSPAPAMPFSPGNGAWGAWELAARYSWTDLNYRAGTAGAAAPTGGIRGGTQSAWTAGLNWYPNNDVRFELDYQNVVVKKLSATSPFADIGQTVDIFSLRSQVAF